jgi:acetyl-CoA acetyltransferase
MAGSPEAAIVGYGETLFSRNSSVSSLELNLEAVAGALQDAGLSVQSIDGIVAPAILGATVDDLCTSLNLPDLAFSASMITGGAGPSSAIGLAAKAIEANLCHRVLVSFGYNGYSEQRLGYRPPQIMFGESASFRRNYEAVHGLLLPAQYYSLWATRYMHDFGWTDTLPFASVAVTQREHARLNKRAMRQTPMTVEEHQQSRVITSPFRLLDCSQETDGAVAVVVTRADDPQINASTPKAVIAGWGQAKPAFPDQSITRPEFLSSAFVPASRRAFSMAGVSTDDIDFAQIYDPFTFHVIWQLESLGFCRPGEAKDFVLSGENRIGGTLPVNTHGGLLSEAHLWGMNHVTEAVRQLRGTAEGAQVEDAQWGLVTGTGDFGDASVLVLRRES